MIICFKANHSQETKDTEPKHFQCSPDAIHWHLPILCLFSQIFVFFLLIWLILISFTFSFRLGFWNHWEDVQAAEILEEAYNRCDGVGEEEGDSPPISVPEPVQKNRELRKQVGSRPFEYVQRLHKNLGHVSNNTLCRMLEEVQATDDVMTAAKNYVCPQKTSTSASQFRREKHRVQ